MRSNTRPTLVIRPEKLGDLVVATPAIQALKNSFPESPLHVLTDNCFSEVLKEDPHVDKCISIQWRSRRREKRESCISILKKIRRERYSRCAILYANWEPWNWLTAMSDIPEVAQIGGTCSALFLGHKMVKRSGYMDKPTHYSEWYLRVAEALGAKPSDTFPRAYVTPSEVQSVLARFSDFRALPHKVILHLGGSPEGDNYSVSALSRLAPQLATALGTPIFVTGLPSDLTNWKNLDPHKVREDLLGNLTLRELMSIFSICDLGIMNSTGTIHLAAALGAKVLGLYGAHPGNDAKTWGPFCQCSSILAPDVNIYMEAIKENKSKHVALETLIPEGKIINSAQSLLQVRKISDSPSPFTSRKP